MTFPVGAFIHCRARASHWHGLRLTEDEYTAICEYLSGQDLVLGLHPDVLSHTGQQRLIVRVRLSGDVVKAVWSVPGQCLVTILPHHTQRPERAVDDRTWQRQQARHERRYTRRGKYGRSG